MDEAGHRFIYKKNQNLVDLYSAIFKRSRRELMPSMCLNIGLSFRKSSSVISPFCFSI